MTDVQYVRGEVAAQPLFAPDSAPTQNRSVFPRFFRTGHKRPDGSYHEVEMVEILIAGDRKSGAVKKVTEFIKARWPEQYATWKRGEELAHNGTSVDIWPPIADHPALIQILKLNHIHTVEALAEIADTALEPLGLSARKMREAARLYCDSKDDGVEQMRDENERLREQMQVMQQQIDQLLARGPVQPDETPAVAEPAPSDSVEPGEVEDWTEIQPWPARASFVRDKTGTRPANMAEAEELMSALEAA